MDKGFTFKKLLLTILFLLLAIFLPRLTMRVQRLEEALVVMHIPIYLCGFICGAPWGFAAGMAAPVLRSVIFGAPQMYPEAVAMMFELAFYGLLSGMFYDIFARSMKGRHITESYFALVVAMFGGRLAWGAARFVMMLAGSVTFSWQSFISGAFTGEWSAIVLHLLIVPGLVAQMQSVRKR